MSTPKTTKAPKPVECLTVTKARFSPSSPRRGKSGAYRVYYVCFPEYGTVCLMMLLAKNEQADLSKADRNALGKVVTHLKQILERGAKR